MQKERKMSEIAEGQVISHSENVWSPETGMSVIKLGNIENVFASFGTEDEINSSMTPEEVADWLCRKNKPYEFCQSFEGKSVHVCRVFGSFHCNSC